jgi:circadian clock protein KaiC
VTKLTTGDASLDAILGGGVAAGSLLVIGGPPGSGKTILAQQMCFANASDERPAIYYTTWSEPHEKMVRHLSPFSFFDEDALGSRVEFVHLGDLVDEGAGLAGPAEEILRRSLTSKPSLVVIDSSKALHDVVDPREFRRAIYDLASKVAFSEAVLILVGEYGPEEARTEPEFAVADGIIELENTSSGPIDRRRLRVLKMRGAEVMSGAHSFRLGSDGFEAFPRLETTLPRHVAAQEGRASFGLPGLDAAIGGGVPRGDSTLVIGPSGIGKTLLAMSFIDAGLRDGERCLHLSLQETAGQVREKAAAAGFDWGSYADDRLTIQHIAPVEVDLDQIGTFVRAQLEGGDVKRVVIDSLAELEFAARDTDRLPGYVWALGGFVRAAGGTTIFTNEMAALGSGNDLGGLSFIFNNVFFMRYVEIDATLRRGLSVLKMRQSSHANGLLEFEIGAAGVEFGELFTSVTGMLGWSALRGID